jgi:hypothetical protein
MKQNDYNYFGTNFERVFIGCLAILTGLMLAYLAIQGPLFLNYIQYKTHQLVINQLIGQDAVNLFLLCPMLILGGFLLLRKKLFAKYLLIMTPLFLMYYSISYAMGWEWMAQQYRGNSEKYFFHFLGILISALIIMMYSLHIFPKNVKATFIKSRLAVYTALYSIFLIAFAMLWMKEVFSVIETGTARAYDIAPGAFWLVRVFDLGFSIPLGLISIYMLWVRPEKAYPVQYLFYGFFLTQLTAVLAMAFMMYINNDPTFEWNSSLIFVVLCLIVVSGFVYINKSYRLKAR